MSIKVLSTLFRDPYKWIALPLGGLLIAVAIIFMQVVNDLRIYQINKAMQEYGRYTGAGPSAALISRFQLIKRRLTNKEESEDDYLKEGRLISVISAGFQKINKQQIRYPMLRVPATILLNTLSKLNSQQLFINAPEGVLQRQLELAYLYERKRRFGRAIDLYNQALASVPLLSSDYYYIYLHKGYCNALSGNSQKALSDLYIVIKQEKNREMATTANILALFLRTTQRKANEISKMKDSVNKGVAYYNIMAYSDAIKTLTKLDDKSSTLFFFRGRSYEELGKISKAIQDYRKTILLNPLSIEAKKANRRLYLLGAFYEGNEALKKESIDRSHDLNDVTFFEKSKVIEKGVNLENDDRIEAAAKQSNIISATLKEKPIINTKESQLQSKEIQQAITEKITSEKRTPGKPIIKPIDTFNINKFLKADFRERINIFRDRFKFLDKITLSNGSVLKGVIQEDDGKTIKIITLYGWAHANRKNIRRKEKVANRIKEP